MWVRIRLGQAIFAGEIDFHRADVAQSLAPVVCQIDQVLGLFHVAVRRVPLLSHEQTTISTPRRCAAPAPYDGVG